MQNAQSLVLMEREMLFSGVEGKWTSQYGLGRTHGTVESRQHNNTITVTHWRQASACSAIPPPSRRQKTAHTAMASLESPR